MRMTYLIAAGGMLAAAVAGFWAGRREPPAGSDADTLAAPVFTPAAPAQLLRQPDEEPSMGGFTGKLQTQVASLEREVLRLDSECQRLREENQEFEARLARAPVSDRSEPAPPAMAEAERQALRDRVQALRDRAGQERQQRLDFFKAFETSALTPEERKSHAELLAGLASVGEIEGRIGQATTAEERLSLSRDLNAKKQDVQKLLVQERRILVSDLAQRLGLDAARSQPFTEYLNFILDATETRASAPFVPRGAFGAPRRILSDE